MAGGGEFFCPLEGFHHHLFGPQNRFVEIDLPVHQPPGDEEFFNGINALFLHHQFPIVYGEHFDDAVIPDDPLVDPGEKTVPVEVVHAVHVQLAGDELVEEFFWVFVFENTDGEGELPAKFLVQPFHEKEGDFFMVDIDEGMLQSVRKGAMPDVMEQNGDGNSLGLLLRNVHSFGAKHVDGLPHEVERTEGMVETGVERAGVNIMGEAQLFDAPQPLEPRVLHEVEKDVIWNADETVNGVVENFLLVHAAKVGGDWGLGTGD